MNAWVIAWLEFHLDRLAVTDRKSVPKQPIEVNVVTDESNDYRSLTASGSVGMSIRSARTLNKLRGDMYLLAQNTRKPPH